MKVLNLINLLENSNFDYIKKSPAEVTCFVEIGVHFEPYKLIYPIYGNEYRKLIELLNDINRKPIDTVLSDYKFIPTGKMSTEITDDSDYYCNVVIKISLKYSGVVILNFDPNDPHLLLGAELGRLGNSSLAKNFILSLRGKDYYLEDFFYLVDDNKRPINIPTSHSEKIK